MANQQNGNPIPSGNGLGVTQGCIASIFRTGQCVDTPVVQMVDIKKIVTSNNGERYRLVISDGLNYIQGMLATQITDMVNQPNGIKKHALVRLDEFVCNTINNRRIVIVIRCGVVAFANGQIGQPTNIQPGAGSPMRNNNGNNNNNNSNNNNNNGNNQNQNQNQNQNRGV